MECEGAHTTAQLRLLCQWQTNKPALKTTLPRFEPCLLGVTERCRTCRLRRTIWCRVASRSRRGEGASAADPVIWSTLWRKFPFGQVRCKFVALGEPPGFGTLTLVPKQGQGPK